MLVETKKYGGDALRAYKALMRKLKREGFYQEVKRQEFYKSRGQQLREEKVKNTKRTQKKQAQGEKQLVQQDLNYPKKSRRSKTSGQQRAK